MSVKNPQERLDKWDRKFNTERVKAILDDEKPTMKIHAGARFAEITAMEGRLGTRNKLSLIHISEPTRPY